MKYKIIINIWTHTQNIITKQTHSRINSDYFPPIFKTARPGRGEESFRSVRQLDGPD